MEKKIATSVEVLIKVAQYESIRITKYGETKIEYDSSEEMQKKEDQLNSEVLADLERSVRKLPETFSKAPDNIIEDFGEKIQNKIPTWLAEGSEPNIANGAKSSHEKSDFKSAEEEMNRKERTNSTTTEMEELFAPDPVEEDNSVDSKSASSDSASDTSEVKSEKTEDKNEDTFDEDDLFA